MLPTIETYCLQAIKYHVHIPCFVIALNENLHVIVLKRYQIIASQICRVHQLVIKNETKEVRCE